MIRRSKVLPVPDLIQVFLRPSGCRTPNVEVLRSRWEETTTFIERGKHGIQRVNVSLRS